jgi:hypothetical protein
MSTSVYVVSRAVFSFSTLAFRLAKALPAESGSPGTMPRDISCSLNTTQLDGNQLRTSFEHDPITKTGVGEMLTILHLALLGQFSLKLHFLGQED